MIKIENVSTAGWEPALRGMRNPMNSWGKADSKDEWVANDTGEVLEYVIGPNDHKLAMQLRNAGTDHRKFLRMIVCYADITAPLYWWKQADCYRNGVEKNSCSTMHKVMEKEFTPDDFSHDHLESSESFQFLLRVLDKLNELRGYYLRQYAPEIKKSFWYELIQLLPSSYNQRRTVMMSYEALANMYTARKFHKLDEWREFCRWVESLPYAELITGEVKNHEDF